VSRTSRLEIIHNLRERLQQLERSDRPARTSGLVTGSALDQLLPGQEWSAGTLVEWLGEGDGSGAATLALAVSTELLRHGGALVVIDSEREFYPPALTGAGLERMVVIQPHDASAALWATEQALHSRAVAVTLARIGPGSDRVFRRLQLAAEAGGGPGFLLRPARCRTEPPRGVARLWVEAAPEPRPLSGWRLRILVLHRRGGAAGEAVEVELSHEARLMPASAPLARPALLARAAGA
jgi:protein ImuA